MSAPERGARHRSREVALQVLFSLDLRAAKDETTAAQEVFDDIAVNFEMPEATRTFAKELVCGVASRAAELDESIAAAASNWRIERMAVVDRNVLRLATYELLQSETPTAVVLDEAVRMAQRFGDDPSPAFVNGVLDAVARRLRPDRGPDRRRAGV